MTKPNENPDGILRQEVLRAILQRLLAGGVTPDELTRALREAVAAQRNIGI